MVAFALVYLIIGVLITTWSAIDMYRSKVPVENEDGTISDRRVITQIPATYTSRILLFLLTLWPVAVLARMLWRPDSGNDNDPQDRVPPEYR